MHHGDLPNRADCFLCNPGAAKIITYQDRERAAPVVQRRKRASQRLRLQAKGVEGYFAHALVIAFATESIGNSVSATSDSSSSTPAPSARARARMASALRRM